MSDYIVLVVTSVGLSMCLSGVIIGIIKGDIDTDMAYLRTSNRSLWERIKLLGDELDILRARTTDLENKLKEMEKVDDGK